MASLLEKKEKGLSSVVGNFFDNDRLFEGFPLDFFKGRFPSISSEMWPMPSVNITEDTGNYHFEIPAPGFEKPNINVKVENGILHITAKKSEEKEEEKKNFLRKEFSYNSFARSFRLPENSNSDKLAARYTNGVLKLTLPKKEASIERPGKEIKVE
ncbi:MAG TPA: Hsp20/alpha crystallin family protein [Bacteroidia bacterium]|nr:Hsp20/alpha crystallin family protein [Bacteroidia bacterium]